MKTDKIEINGQYQGYIWYSNASEPEIYIGNKDIDIRSESKDNPFIIEGHLYKYKDNTMESISIKHIDGEYHINKYSEIPESNDNCSVRDREFISHRMEGRILCFKEVWRTEEDNLCAGFKVLKPCELIFVGFKK